MTRQTWILLGILALSGVGYVATKLPRGVRNNNPGNIRESYNDKTSWVGERTTDDDPAFEEFNDPVDGFRAMARTLRSYYVTHGLRSIKSIIERYAPSTENDTKMYYEKVASALGFSPLYEMKDNEFKEYLPTIIVAMTHVEQGSFDKYFTLEQVHTGIQKAFA